MDIVEEFFRATYEEFLEQSLREQLIKITGHFELDVGDQWLKENMKNILEENLMEVGVLQSKSPAVSASAVNDTDVNSGLTFEQCRDLPLLQAEIKRLKLEESRLGLSNVPVISPGNAHGFDVTSNLRLVPQFSETHFSNFLSR